MSFKGRPNILYSKAVNPLIDLQGVTKTYPNGVCALDGVDLHIEKGEFVFVVGHSGAGKSTLIKTLLREEVPTEGDVTVNGHDLIHMKRTSRSGARQHRLVRR